MLTAIDRQCPARCHSAACRIACLITHSPSAVTLPVDSASEMSSSGASTACSPSNQRTSASAEVIVPVSRSSTGW